MEKQEESAAEQEAETMEQCIARHMAANEELTEEAARAKCEEERKPKEGGEAEKTLKGQMEGVMKEYGAMLVDQMKKDIGEKMRAAIEETREQFVSELKKGLGIEKDPVIHLSDMNEMVRKILLENTEPGKRTETETVEKPTEGEDKERKLEKAEDIYKRMTKDRGVV